MPRRSFCSATQASLSLLCLHCDNLGLAGLVRSCARALIHTGAAAKYGEFVVLLGCAVMCRDPASEPLTLPVQDVLDLSGQQA